jgi:hypothetical protein
MAGPMILPSSTSSAANISRPCPRFVPIKTEDQQAVLVMHCARDLLVRRRTQPINAPRGVLSIHMDHL